MIMRFSIVATILAITFAGSGFAADGMTDGMVTMQSARMVVEASEAAEKNNDPDKAAMYLSDDGVLRSTDPKPGGGTVTNTHTRQQYLDDAHKMKSEGLDRRYESTRPSISIKDGKAIAKMRVTETLTRGDKSLVGVADQVETLEMRNGKVMITAVDSTMVSLTINGQRQF
jgi:hypothetical protein